MEWLMLFVFHLHRRRIQLIRQYIPNPKIAQKKQLIST